MARKKSSKPAQPIKTPEASPVPDADLTTAAPPDARAPLPVLGGRLPADMLDGMSQFAPPVPMPAVPAHGAPGAVPPLPPRPLLPVAPGRAAVPGARIWVGKPTAATLASASGPGVPRVHNPTFDPPPQDITEARNRALHLRQILGSSMTSLQQAIVEIDQVKAFLAARPDLAEEFLRLDISLEEADRFRTEALDVVNAFKPMSGTPG